MYVPRQVNGVPMCGNKVTNGLFEPFIYKSHLFYQDRLGTNIGKTQERLPFCRRRSWWIPSATNGASTAVRPSMQFEFIDETLIHQDGLWTAIGKAGTCSPSITHSSGHGVCCGQTRPVTAARCKTCTSTCSGQHIAWTCL
jgi:hypothetical protein